MTLKEILEYNFLKIGDLQLSLVQVIIAILFFLFARFVIRLISKLATNYFTRKGVDLGRQYAFKQFVKYVVYLIAFFLALEAIGIQFSVIWGGAAALLVGFGLGLQQTFNDLVSGVILLLEGTVEVGDIIEVNSVVGRVTDIGIRTTKIKTRDDIIILLPNSKIIGDSSTNWSHNRTPIRHKIEVGVSYASDINLVTSLLLTAVVENKGVENKQAPSVQFSDFGNSSLNFKLYFYSKSYMGIEVVKSEIRYRIMGLFREHNIEIPFPQQDLWLRNSELLFNKS